MVSQWCTSVRIIENPHRRFGCVSSLALNQAVGVTDQGGNACAIDILTGRTTWQWGKVWRQAECYHSISCHDVSYIEHCVSDTCSSLKVVHCEGPRWRTWIEVQR